jgi:peptidyl-prolyl cis-trans isomerase C
MKVFLLLTLPAISLLLACGAQNAGPADTADTEGDVLATVGDSLITAETIQRELEKIPPYQRANFETPEGKRILLDHLVERQLLLQAAIDAGLEEDSFVVAQVEEAMRQMESARQRALIQTYYESMVVDSVDVPEDTIMAYYEEHSDDIYHQDAQVRVAHILADDEEAAQAALEAVQAGMDFSEAAESLSTHSPTASSGGEIGWVRAGAPVPYLGSQPELARTLFETEEAGLVGPVETDLGWHVFTVLEAREEGPRPLDEVREQIVQALRPGMVNAYFNEEVIPSLRERYSVTVNDNAFLPADTVPADSLMTMAQELMERSPEQAVRYFRLFLERFPEDDRAYQAQFLIGFTYSEYMQDYDAAEEAFRAVIENYPESDMADDAEFMLENMRTPADQLIPPEEGGELPEEAVPDEASMEGEEDQ